jgi:RNA polymerase sigma-70 factor (ECF subfamily)
METIDKDIVIRLKHGDMEAFESLVSFYEKAVYNYCLRLIGEASHAKDITQDTFIKIYTHHKKIDTEKNIKSWIFTIATNTAYDFLRSHKGRKSINLEEDNETFHVLATYTNTEGLITDVNKALDAIKLEYKNPIVLYYKQGFDYKEIAEILSLPINTVKTHISRGKEQLKKLLKNYGEN